MKKTASKALPTFYEFFAGGGMARAGLGNGWNCLFANDFDAKKAETYGLNWGKGHFCLGDVAKLSTKDLPDRADLVWASFPCQDLSLAGAGAGLDGHRSGTFWPFWELVRQLGREARRPPLVVLENVCGALSSHNGKDFSAICAALAEAGYRFGAIVVDAVKFLPQSRPRLFIIAIAPEVLLPDDISGIGPMSPWHSEGLEVAYNGLPAGIKSKWIWWRLPLPATRKTRFVDIIEDEPQGVEWHSPEQTKQLLALMNSVNRTKVSAAKQSGKREVGCVYKRTRKEKSGEKFQRAEVRFDDVAGCLRTPSGGSSRQSILIVEGKKVQSRLLSPREAARLMGLPDSYALPEKYNEAYHLAGDGVAVPVVRFLAKHILEPLLQASGETAVVIKKKAA